MNIKGYIDRWQRQTDLMERRDEILESQALIEGR